MIKIHKNMTKEEVKEFIKECDKVNEEYDLIVRPKHAEMDKAIHRFELFERSLHDKQNR